MDDIDLELFEAYQNIRSNPQALARQKRTAMQSTYTQPLRSWCLVLRANDTRIDEQCDTHVVEYKHWHEQQASCAVSEITVTSAAASVLCAPVMIPWPGVSIDQAAKLFGVNRTTIHRWGKSKKSARQNEIKDSQSRERLGFVRRNEGRVVIDYFCRGNGRDLHRAVKCVWTRSPVDTAGQVWSERWGAAIRNLTHRIPADWLQVVQRTHRPLGRRSVHVGLLECCRCVRWCYKLFWPQRIWTVAQAVADTRDEVSADSVTNAFVCRRCAQLIYESAERGSRPSPGRRVNVSARYLKRSFGDCGTQ